KLHVVSGPDLVVADAGYAAGTYRIGDDMGRLTYQYASQGTVLTLAGKQVRAEVRLSTDKIWGNADDVVVMTDTFTWPANVQVGQTVGRTGEATIPPGTPNGQYYLGVMIDADTAVSESNEANNVRWSGAADVEISSSYSLGGKAKAIFPDANGDIVSIWLTGAGGGTVALPSGGGDATSIVLTGTDATSLLIVRVKRAGGGNGRTSTGDLSADSDMRAVVGALLDVTGDVDLAGTIGKLTLGNIADDHVINIGGSVASKPISIALGRVANTVLNSLSPIKSLTVTEWLDDNAVADAVNASVIGKLSAKGAKANAKKGIAFSAGNFQADVDLDGFGATKATLASAIIAGDLD
ncbi:hypothetical protein LCGC14_3073260, partial [marine sediment metagenome]